MEFRMKTGAPPSLHDLYAYDALWTIALALNESNATACTNQLQYEDLVQCIRHNGKALQAEIERTDFIGVSVGRNISTTIEWCWTVISYTGLSIVSKRTT